MIKINKITLKNFGGIASGEYNFTNNTTIIEAGSGLGKTSAYYAYLWALGFNVPSWEPQIDGYRILKLKTEVFVELNIDGIVYIIGKTNTPKHKLNKFTGDEEYVGTDYKYIIDGQEKESLASYKEKIEELFKVDYFTLELLSKTELFNNEDGKRWDKNERRKYLFKLFDLENKINELALLPEFETIKEYLEKGNDEIEINNVINTLKRNIDREMNDNQVLLEDKQKEIAIYSNIDFASLALKKEELRKQLDELKHTSIDNAQNTILDNYKQELFELRNAQRETENINKDILADYEGKIKELERELDKIEPDIIFLREKIVKLQGEIDDCDIELESIVSTIFDEKTTICPTCQQKLPEEKIAEIIKDFETNKAIQIENIKSKTQNNATDKQTSEDRLNTLYSQKEVLIGRINELKENKPQLNDFDATKITELEEKINNISASDNINDEVTSKITELQAEYDSISAELGKQVILESIIKRIDELKTRTRELGNQDQKRIAMKTALTKYTQRKIDLVNDEVNKNFEGVRYNFFHWLSAGSAKDFELVANAVLVENGTEYDNLSSGQRVKVDLLTNNSLRKILGVNIPQFVDDVVLSDLNKSNNNWQTIYLLTNNDKKLDVTLIKDCYSLKDCEIRKA